MKRHVASRLPRGATRWTAGSIVASLAVLVALAGSARAEEPFRPFLDELYRRQMFDVALMYLESLRQSPLVSDEVKATLTYEEGVTLVEGAGYERDIPKRKKNLELAREKLTTFIKDNAEHPLAGSARIQLGNILINRAQANLELAKVPSQAAKKDALLEEARALFSEAEKVCAEAEEKFDAQVKAFPKFIDPEDKKQVELREQVKLDLIQARLLGAMASYEASKAYEPTAPERKALLEKAAGKFAKVYDAYRKLLAGLYAHMYEGRCHQDLGNPKKALSVYGELLLQPDDPQEFRDLKASTLSLAMQCWNSETEKKYDESITRGEDWVKKMRGNEDRTPEGLTIRWLLVQAYDLRSGSLKDGDAKKVNDQKAALEHASAVAKVTGEYQQAAREFVAKVRNVAANTDATNFAEALTKGRSALDALQVAINQGKLAEASGEQDKIAEFKKQELEAREDAVKNLNLALSMRKADTPVEEVNQARYYLCFLNYQNKRFYDAAVLGEFIARNYKQSSNARKAAQLALASYLGAYTAAAVDSRQFEQDKMVEIAKYTGETWPGEVEADEAWMILGDIATRAGNTEQATEYLKNIGPESPKRAEADLKLGQALWSMYLKKSRLPAAEQPPAADMQAMVANSQQTLEAGVQKMRAQMGEGATVSFALLNAELCLAQLYVGSAQVDKGIALLETPGTGLLALVGAKDPAATKANMPTETYKAALRAYVAAQNIPKAEEMMTLLEAAVGNGDPALLTNIYLGLGRDLEEQVTRLRQEQKNDDLKKVLQGFELFLDKIASRGQGLTFNSLMWVAETYFRLGEGLDTGGKVTPEGEKYYTKAIATYEQILKRCKEEKEFGPSPETANSISVRMARSERQMGNYQQAIDRLVAVLKVKPNALEAQTAAAETYESWGKVDPKNYLFAVQGAQRFKRGDGTVLSLVWGWNKLAQTVQKLPQYKALYFESRLKVAECLYMYGMAQQGADRTKAFDRAESAITVLAKLEQGNFGDPESFDNFDRLLRQIRKANNSPNSDGLQAVIDELAKAAAANSAAPADAAAAAPAAGTPAATGAEAPPQNK